jgi:hypothetical protein
MNVFGSKTAGRWPLILSFVFFAALWALDFPKPYFDDLFYCGAGLNLAQGGDFSNPLLARQNFPNHFFFVYPPIHSYAIAGWMKLFGVGARSLTAFQDLMYVLIAAATLAVLRRLKVPVWLEFLVPLGVAGAFLPMGLRPEPLSVALTMTGFAMIEGGCRKNAPVFIAFLLLLLGGATAPRLTLFSGALVLLAGYRLWQNSTAPGWKRWSFCLCALGAMLVAIFIFLLMIGFRPHEFLETFHFHARRLDAGKIQLLEKYFHDVGKTQLPVFFLAPIVFLFSLRQPKNELFYCGAIIAVAFLSTAMIGGIGHGSAWYAVLMMLFLTAAISRNGVRHKVCLPAALFLVLFVASGKSLMNVAGIFYGDISSGRGGQYEEALQLHSTPEHPVLVDFSVARYVYDYKIPAGFLDFEFSAPFPGIGVTDYFQHQDIYVVSPENVDNLKCWTRLDVPRMQEWSFCGVSRLPFLGRWTLYRHPGEAFVIPAENCGGLRAETSQAK